MQDSGGRGGRRAWGFEEDEDGDEDKEGRTN